MALRPRGCAGQGPRAPGAQAAQEHRVEHGHRAQGVAIYALRQERRSCAAGHDLPCQPRCRPSSILGSLCLLLLPTFGPRKLQHSEKRFTKICPVTMRCIHGLCVYAHETPHPLSMASPQWLCVGARSEKPSLTLLCLGTVASRLTWSACTTRARFTPQGVVRGMQV